VVSPAAPSGTQTWTRVVGGSLPAAVTVMLFNASGAYLVSPGSAVAGTQSSCSFAAPIPWPIWPTTVGRSTSGHATCRGPVTTYQVTSVVQGSATLTLDARTVTAAVVVNTIVITGRYNATPLNVTTTETDYYIPTLRVPVLTKTHLVGSVIGISVTTDRTDTLESSTPA
jgi:hypothetical protein